MKARISEQNTDGWQEVVARNDLCFRKKTSLLAPWKYKAVSEAYEEHPALIQQINK